MIVEGLVVGTGAVIAYNAARIEYLKSKQLELSDEEKEAILSDDARRFIHFTPKERAQKIIEAGYFIPTKGAIKNHFARNMGDDGKRKNSDLVYMFDSKTFSVDDYIRNLPRENSPYNGNYEFYAVSHKPDKYEINNFKRRAQDGAITYEGRLDIDGTDTKITKFVLDLDKEGNYTFNEVSKDFEYTPSDELLEKLKKDKMGLLKFNAKYYMSELKKSRESIKKYRLEKKEYKEQIRKKKEFARVNKQFKEEEKEKAYVFEQDGKKIVVSNLGYEMIGGRKLQRISIIKNKEEDKFKKADELSKDFYIDECDISKTSPEIGAKFFSEKYESIDIKDNEIPEYIGLPEKEYDEEFKRYMDKRKEGLIYSNSKSDNTSSSGFLAKIKNIFSNLIGRNKDLKRLDEPKSYKEKEREREDLAKLGYSSVEAMNKDDKDITILDELGSLKYPPDEVAKNYANEKIEGKGIDEKGREECL